jgi:signal transduction histidine kinase
MNVYPFEYRPTHERTGAGTFCLGAFMSEGSATGYAAVGEWAELCESLVRGLVHSLNNRITALSAFAQLRAMGDEDYAPHKVLPAELPLLSSVSDHLRTLSQEKLPVEAIEIAPVLNEAIGLHAHHPVLRGIRCEVRTTTSLLPVRVPRWALSRLFVMLIDNAKRVAEETGEDHVPLVLEGNEQVLALRTHSDGTISMYAHQMAALCGATIQVTDDEVVARIPTLLELRRRERGG